MTTPSVKEVVITGVIGRWFHRRGWGAVTLPTLRGTIKIRYWVVKDPDVAAHERSIHVPQIREMGGLRYLWTYAREWLAGFYVSWRLWKRTFRKSFEFAYKTHPMEWNNWRLLLRDRKDYLRACRSCDVHGNVACSRVECRRLRRK